MSSKKYIEEIRVSSPLYPQNTIQMPNNFLDFRLVIK